MFVAGFFQPPLSHQYHKKMIHIGWVVFIRRGIEYPKTRLSTGEPQGGESHWKS
jgi:hypothetical protein